MKAAAPSLITILGNGEVAKEGGLAARIASTSTSEGGHAPSWIRVWGHKDAADETGKARREAPSLIEILGDGEAASRSAKARKTGV